MNKSSIFPKLCNRSLCVPYWGTTATLAVCDVCTLLPMSCWLVNNRKNVCLQAEIRSLLFFKVFLFIPPSSSSGSVFYDVSPTFLCG